MRQLRPIIAFGTCHLPSSSWLLALPLAHRRLELISPHFLGAISGSQNRGALMRQIISSVYAALLFAIWIGVMGTVIAVLDSGEPKWLLVVAGFVAATITVTRSITCAVLPCFLARWRTAREVILRHISFRGAGFVWGVGLVWRKSVNATPFRWARARAC